MNGICLGAHAPLIARRATAGVLQQMFGGTRANFRKQAGQQQTRNKQTKIWQLMDGCLSNNGFKLFPSWGACSKLEDQALEVQAGELVPKELGRGDLSQNGYGIYIGLYGFIRFCMDLLSLCIDLQWFI